jgi:hypothetical protein
MNLMEKWLHYKEIIKQQTELLHEVEADIWLEAEKLGQLNPKGSKTFELDGFKITITHGTTYTVAQGEAATRPELFKVKYEYSSTMYRDLVQSQKDFVDEIVTSKPSKPNFKVERV